MYLAIADGPHLHSKQTTGDNGMPDGPVRRKHIIVEGMDGAGKDTLIASLMRHKNFVGMELHDRASTSLGGPVPSLDEWVVNDVAHLETKQLNRRYIYNRHPLISEPIYAGHRHTNRGLSGRFRDRNWVNMMRQIMSRHAIVVFCQPPWWQVKDNIERDREAHMPGVAENAVKLYGEYATLVWPGVSIRYDYTRNAVADLIPLIKNRIGRFNG
jgi:predicted ATPase